MSAEHLDPNQPLTLTQLWPWMAGIFASAVSLAIALFRWVFLTTVIEEIRSLKSEIKALTEEVNDLKIQSAVMAEGISELKKGK